MGFLKSTGTFFIYVGLFLAVITFMPGLPPEAEFSEYFIVPPKELTGRLGPNNRLKDAVLLHKGQIKGPESFDSYNGELYTGLHRGYVVKIDEKQIVPIVKFGEKCDELWQEDKCGRPLGLKFNKKGELYVTDAYYGIFKVDVQARKYEKIVDISKPINGKVAKIPNYLDITENGDIYWTDSSTEFPLYDGLYSFLANPSGRLIRYNAAKKTNEVLLENLGFANGVKLSDDESFLIVLETMASRIVKYNLKGPNAGKSEMFAVGLPGMPDNVHSDGGDGFLVTLIVHADSQNPQLSQSLTPHPYLRKMFARLLGVMEAPLKMIQNCYPNPYTARMIHSIGSFEGMSAIFESKSVVLRLNKKGEIIDAAYTSDPKVAQFSSAFIHKGDLWLGGPFNEFAAKVPLKQAFPSLTVNEKHSNTDHVRVKRSEQETQKVESKTTKKPTTTSTTTTTTSTTTTTTTTTTTPKPSTQKSKSAPEPVVSTTTPKPTPAPKPVVQNKDKLNSEAGKSKTPEPPKKTGSKSETPSKAKKSENIKKQ